ncbi:hypothetical protein [Thalassobellus citreus]|uniref:hypothetical protein n=1 Tax=Thalassobellus citreus TaxID=3367752 RepID=UPI00379E9A4E
MKRTVLLFAGLLVGLTTASAKTLTTNNNGNNLNKTKHYRYAEPITFVERGVEFLIFPDGSFDFNTNINYNKYNDTRYYKSNSKRNKVNTRYNNRNARFKYTSNYNKGINIVRDRSGKVRRIGNVFLNYDRYGKITRAGNVFMNYNRGRNNTLIQVGGLHVNYNRWGGIINMRGHVNRFNADCNTSYSYNKKNRHQNNNWNNNDYYKHDDNYYYFKQSGKVKKQKKNKR